MSAGEQASGALAIAILLLIVIMFVLGRATFTVPAGLLVWTPAAGAAALAVLLGVPAWRFEPFGDGFDIFFLTAFVNACALRLASWWLL